MDKQKLICGSNQCKDQSIAMSFSFGTVEYGKDYDVYKCPKCGAEISVLNMQKGFKYSLTSRDESEPKGKDIIEIGALSVKEKKRTLSLGSFVENHFTILEAEEVVSLRDYINTWLIWNKTEVAEDIFPVIFRDNIKVGYCRNLKCVFNNLQKKECDNIDITNIDNCPNKK